MFNIRKYGAIGDGKANDTVAVQTAIDACHAAGGGLVLCPPGTYRIGSFELRSHVNLHVEGGAVLLASADRRDYIKRLPFDAIIKNPNHGNFDEPLVYAAEAENFSITGRGMIDGNGRAFFLENPEKPGGTLRVRDWRPGMLLTFVACRDVLLRDIHLIDPPCYTVFPLGCEQVVIDGITIRSRGPNTDGIDLHCCRDVRISNCSIDTGDDCITCYSMPYWLKNPGPCENVTVANCTLATAACCGVRIGYAPSDLPVRNLAFSNLVMHCGHGINFLCPRETDVRIACETHAQHGPALENIAFDNIVMDVGRAIYLWTDSDTLPPAGIRNLSISNVTATVRAGCFIGGNPATPIETLRIHNLALTVKGTVKGEPATDPPDPIIRWGCAVPHALYVRYARNVVLSDLAVDWGRAEGAWRSALRAKGVQGLAIANLTALGHSASAHPAVHLTDVQDAYLRGCRVSEGQRLLECDGDCSGVHVATDGNVAVGRASD